jgi:hypothetical protein
MIFVTVLFSHLFISIEYALRRYGLRLASMPHLLLPERQSLAVGYDNVIVELNKVLACTPRLGLQ